MSVAALLIWYLWKVQQYCCEQQAIKPQNAPMTRGVTIKTKIHLHFMIAPL
jgi:hypothetical protein